MKYITAASAILESGVRSVDAALTEYRKEQINEGNKPASVETTMYRLRALFRTQVPSSTYQGLNHLLPRLTDRLAVRVYETYKISNTRTGRPPTADTYLNTLAEAKTFLNWCVERKYMSSNPLAGVKPNRKKDRRRKGKDKLRADEARPWTAHVVERAAAGEEQAVAVLTAFVLGLRASEVLKRRVSDLDDDGRLFEVTDAKTEAGERCLDVPDFLRPLLLAQAAKSWNGFLFPSRRAACGHRSTTWLRKWVQQYCDQAGVKRITTHGLRGTHTALARQRGMSGHAVSASVGHSSERTTNEHYTGRDVLDRLQRDQVLGKLDGAIEAGIRASAADLMAAKAENNLGPTSYQVGPKAV